MACLSVPDSHAAQQRLAGKLFPTPASLKPNVDFWIHVFARLEGGSGVLHDDEDLGIIYETLKRLPRDRERRQKPHPTQAQLLQGHPVAAGERQAPQSQRR